MSNFARRISLLLCRISVICYLSVTYFPPSLRPLVNFHSQPANESIRVSFFAVSHQIPRAPQNTTEIEKKICAREKQEEKRRTLKKSARAPESKIEYTTHKKINSKTRNFFFSPQNRNTKFPFRENFIIIEICAIDWPSLYR